MKEKKPGPPTTLSGLGRAADRLRRLPEPDRLRVGAELLAAVLEQSDRLAVVALEIRGALGLRARP